MVRRKGNTSKKNDISKHERKIKLKNGDTVIVISGKDKGKKGKIQKNNYKNNMCLVEEVNMVTKHKRPTQDSPNGNIIRSSSLIHISNVMYFSNKVNRGVRIGYKYVGEGKDRKKIRVGRYQGQEIELK
jgi:large subunit ribosomal protein L24